MQHLWVRYSHHEPMRIETQQGWLVADLVEKVRTSYELLSNVYSSVIKVYNACGDKYNHWDPVNNLKRGRFWSDALILKTVYMEDDLDLQIRSNRARFAKLTKIQKKHIPCDLDYEFINDYHVGGFESNSNCNTLWEQVSEEFSQLSRHNSVISLITDLFGTHITLN